MKMKNCSLLFLCSALKQLVIIVSSLLLFAACKKDANHSPETEPLTFAEVRPGDTLIIKGKNFSEVLTNNIVKFNGVEATVISASPTELKVLVPAGATSGSITITVNGVTIEAGSVTIIPFTLYTIKVNYQNSKQIEQLVSIDPANGKESVIVTLTDLPKYDNLKHIVYLASTNEIVGLTKNRKNLFKINVTTKQSTLVVLSDQDNYGFTELVVDKNANLYALKEDWSDPKGTQSLVKVDPKTGTTTEVNKAFEYDNYWHYLVYLGASNEVAGILSGGDRLLKVNLTTKDTSTTRISNTRDITFDALVADKQSNLYGITYNSVDRSKPPVYQIVKLNGAGEQTVLSTLPQFAYQYYTAFIPQRNEIAVISQDKRLYRVNINTQASTTDDLTRDQSIYYRELTIN